jgi:hypothetical protein
MSRLAATPVHPRTISPRIGLVQAVNAPAQQLGQDEQPCPGRDPGRPVGAVGGPDRRRNLEHKRRGQRGAALRDEALATLPGVQRLTSTIVMKRVVDDRPLPFGQAPALSPQRARPRRKR